MKIAYLSFNLFPSHYAHTVQIMKMCQAFKNLNHDVTLFAQKHEKYTSDEKLFNDYLITNTFYIHWLKFPKNNLLYRLKILWTIFRLNSKFDLYYTRNIFLAVCLIIFNKKAILELHSDANSKLERLLLPLVFKSNIKIVTISNALAEYLSIKYRISIKRFIIEHDAYDLEELKKIKPHGLIFPARVNQKYIIYVGSFYPGRGIDLIIELAKRFPEHFFLCIGGNDNEIKNLSYNLKYMKNLFLYKRVEHSKVPAILSEADILIMPYKDKVTIEGKGDTSRFMSPMKMGEYLAAGKPIIASSLPSIMEILVDNVNALLCIPNDRVQWENKLNNLLNDKLLCDKLSMNAKITSNKLTWENRVKNILKK